MNLIDAWLIYLRDLPALTGALCVGNEDLFDPAEHTRGQRDHGAKSRHELALQLCSQCPALSACRAWVDGLAPDDRPAGVVAGLMPGEAFAISAKDIDNFELHS